MTNYTPKAEAVFELHVTCEQPVPVGAMQGGTGLMIPITGGTVKGSALTGKVMPGGADWAVMYDDGRIKVDAHYAIQAEDGTIIQVHNTGVNRIDPEAMAEAPIMLTSPSFVAPQGGHEWLNDAVFVGTLLVDVAGGFSSVDITIFRLV